MALLLSSSLSRAAWRKAVAHPAVIVGLALLAGGALSNLADRVFRHHNGAVVDFVQAVNWWPTFNVADAAITVGAVIAGIALVFAPRARDEAEDDQWAPGLGPGPNGSDGADGTGSGHNASRGLPASGPRARPGPRKWVPPPCQAPLRREAGLNGPENEAVDRPLKLLVPPALDTERVDRALALLAGLSRAEASRMIAEGRVRVAEKAVRAGSRRLRSGELLEMERPVAAPGAQARPAPEAAGPTVAAPRAAVVYADEDLVVVDKPAGLVVHPGAGNREGTLVQQLVGLFPDIAGAGPEGERPGIVQRLDKGTSGLLVVALAPAAREALVAQLAARSMERRYLAVVHGQVEADEGLIDAPLGRSPGERLRMAVVEGGRYARTHYRVKARSGVPLPVTLVSCRLETGRTHQLRAHFAAIAHPVYGDEQYSKPSQLAAARAATPELRRPWLHAELLGFVHPTTGQQMSFSSELPPELAETVLTLGLEGPGEVHHGA